MPYCALVDARRYRKISGYTRRVGPNHARQPKDEEQVGESSTDARGGSSADGVGLRQQDLRRGTRIWRTAGDARRGRDSAINQNSRHERVLVCFEVAAIRSE